MNQLELAAGTIELTFVADDVWGRNTLFSKDATGQEVGGHLTAFVQDGRVKVRLQSANGEVWLKTQQGTIQEGQEYHFALTFGDGIPLSRLVADRFEG